MYVISLVKMTIDYKELEEIILTESFKLNTKSSMLASVNRFLIFLLKT